MTFLRSITCNLFGVRMDDSGIVFVIQIIQIKPAYMHFYFTGLQFVLCTGQLVQVNSTTPKNSSLMKALFPLFFIHMLQRGSFLTDTTYRLQWVRILSELAFSFLSFHAMVWTVYDLVRQNLKINIINSQLCTNNHI